METALESPALDRYGGGPLYIGCLVPRPGARTLEPAAARTPARPRPLPPQDGEGRAPFLRGAGDLAAPAAPDAAPAAPAGLRLGVGLGVRMSWVRVS